MKKYTKIALVLGLCLMCLAMVIASFDFEKLLSPFYRRPDNYKEVELKIDPAGINEIFVDTDDERVTIKSTDADVITIRYYESEYSSYKTSENDGVFSLKQKTRIMFFNLNLNFWHEEKVTIEVPRNILLRYTIYTSNSKIEAKGLNTDDSLFHTSNGSITLSNITTTKELDLKTSNSSINISNCEAKRILSKTSNGSINIDNTNSSNINFKTSNASINIQNVTTSILYAKTSNGRIEFKNLKSSKIEMYTSNARIEGKITGNINDYYKDIKTSNNHIEINGNKYGARVIDTSHKENTIKAKSSNGNIDISFNRE